MTKTNRMVYFNQHWTEIKKKIWSSYFLQPYNEVSPKEKEVLVKIAEIELETSPVGISGFGKDRNFFPKLIKRRLIVKVSREIQDL